MMKNKLIIILFGIYTVFLFTSSVFAANHYIRAGATGNNDGTDWANAWTDLPTNLTRGDTYYIADGTYEGGDIEDAEDGTSVITIKKATVADHGTETGWDNAYGDGQAVWDRATTSNTCIAFRTGYYVFDGQSASDPSDSSTYGFKINNTSGGSRWYGIGIPRVGHSSSSPSNVTVRYVAIPGVGVTAGADYDRNIGVYCLSDSGATDILIEHCYFWGNSSNMQLSNMDDSIIQNCWFDGNWSSGDQHGQQIAPARAQNLTFRRNVFKNSTLYIFGYHRSESTENHIYNNIVIGGENAEQGFIVNTDDPDDVRNFEVHHNTLVNFDMSSRGFIDAGSLTDSDYKSNACNNLFINCPEPSMNSSHVNYDYNAYYGCTGTFTPGANSIIESGNPLNPDYSPKIGEAIVDAGKSLASTYNKDIYGTTRPKGAGWDIGAVELYGATLGLDKTTLNYGDKYVGTTSPTTFTITNTGGETLNVASITSGNTSVVTVSPSSTVLAPGNSTTVTVNFSPQAVESYSIPITLSSNAGTKTVMVTGNGIVPSPVINVSPAGLDFATTYIGQSKTESFTISNTGEAALTVSSITTPLSTVSISPTSGSVAVGGSMTVNVTFAPDAVTSYFGKITVVSNDDPQEVTVTGVGRAAPAPVIAVSPSTLNFGSIIENTSSYRTGYILNTGNADLSVSSISSNSDKFTVSPASGTVGMGDTLTVNVTFTPTAVQSYSGAISISSNAGSKTVTLSGAGESATSPEIQVSATDIAFDNLVVGSITSETVTISNTGTEVLTLTKIETTVNPTVFPVNPGLSATDPSIDLDPGASTNITVYFAPQDAQDYTGLISITSNDGVENIGLTGTGDAAPAPVIEVSPTNIDFETVYIGNTETQNVTISNTGSLDLEITDVSTNNEAIFSVSPSTGLVSPGDDMTVTVTFGPDAEQTYSGTVSITSNAGNKSLTVSGAGLTPEPELTVNTSIINFPDTPENTSSTPLAFSIRNTGGADLQITDISATDETVFEASTTSGIVAPGGTMTVTVTFSPDAVEDYAESISITTNAGSKTVSVYGAGISPQPLISLSKTLLNFGTKYTDSETNMTVTVSNTGLSDLTISSITSSDANVFSVSPASANVAPGSTVTVTVSFTPNSAGTHSETITIVSNAGSDKYITVTGVGTESDVPEMTLNTLALNFGSKPVGSNTLKIFTISNTGTDVLSVSDVSSSNSMFTVDPASGTVEPGNSIPVTVTYSPISEGEHLAAISVVSNAGNEHLKISGVGTAELEPFLQLSSEHLAFGSEFVHTIKRKTLTINNTGTDVLLLYDITSSNPDVFFADPTEASIDPDDSLTVIVTFNPQEEKEYSDAFLSYSSNAGDGIVNLSGTGTSSSNSIISLTGDNGLELDTIEMGASTLNTSGNETFTITNNGTSRLNIIDISVSDPEVLFITQTSANLDPGEELTVMVTFTPDEEKTYYESLTITSDSETKVIQINGEGTSSLYSIIKIDKSEVKYGNRVMNTLNFATITVTNMGTADLVIYYVNTSNDSILSATPFYGTINPGKSLIIDVTFTPGELKSFSEKIFISSDAQNIRNIDIPVTGTGITAIIPKLAIEPESYEFGEVYSNETETTTFTLTNDGGRRLEISNISSSTNDIAVSRTSGTVEPGLSIPLTITFAPSIEKEYTEKITLTSNAGTKEIAVNGTGLSATKPILRFESQTVDFDSVLIGSERKQLAGIFNDGNADLSIESITTSNNAILSVSYTERRITPKDKLVLTVGFTPLAESSYFEKIYVASNAGTDTLTITGIGSTVYHPHIESVTIDPDTGWVRVGDSVTITVVEENRVNNLIPSDALINKKSVSLEDQGDGTYVGVYTVAADDAKGRHIEAENITLKTVDGHVSETAYSVGSKLNVDNKPPKIDSVELTDGTAQIEGTLSVGDKITIVVTAGEKETGLTPSDATINSIAIPLADAGDGTYVGEYIIQENDPEGTNIEATDITLTDAAGNVSETASSSGSNLSILGTTPIDPKTTDFNSDGVVDLFDFSMFILSYGSETGDPEWNALYDLNNDGLIDINDFLIFDRYYGNTVAKVAKAADTIAALSESDIRVHYSTYSNVSESIAYVSIQFDRLDALKGFDLQLHFDSDTLEPVTRNIDGLVGLSIPFVRGDVIRIASIFGDEEFEGTVTVGFRYSDNSHFGTVTVDQGVVIESGKVKNISSIIETSYEESVETVIHDLTVNNPSENNVSLSWTSPATVDTIAAYRLDAWAGPEESAIGAYEITTPLGLIPQTAGVLESTRISGLQPGCLYNIMIKTLDTNGRVVGCSNISTTQTLVGFVDEDLDPDDPFIVRDDDSLFVADNDDILKFVWSSWEQSGAIEYEVTIRNETAVEVVKTLTVSDQDVTIKGTAGTTYSVKVIPINAEGERLAVLLSREILCAAGTIEKPERPRIIDISE